MENDLERKWKEAGVVYFEVLSRNMPGSAEKTTKESKPG
jgi:hypothetical protein